jgi:hypothetical protein
MRGSVAPPGWTPSPEFALPPAAVAPAVVSEAADMAVRWRVRAARIDNLIVYGGYLLACLALHWRVAGLMHLFWLAVAGGDHGRGVVIGRRPGGVVLAHLDRCCEPGWPADRDLGQGGVVGRGVIRIHRGHALIVPWTRPARGREVDAPGRSHAARVSAAIPTAAPARSR